MARRTLAPALRRAITGKAIETKGLSGRARSFFRQYVVPGQPYNQAWNTDRAVKEGFEVNPWIYRAVHVIACAVIARTVVIRDGSPDGEPILPEADPTGLLRLMNIQANRWERAKVFQYRLIAQWLLSSRGVYIEIVRSRSGRVAMMNLIDPDMVEIIPTTVLSRTGQKYVDPLGSFRITTNDQSGPYNYLPRYDPKADFADQPNSVLWVRSPHPTLMFRGMSPAQAAGMSADLDRAARMYNRRFMDQDGRPGGILAVKGNVSPDVIDILETRMNGGPAGIGRTTAIQADAMEYVDTSGNPRDTQWADTMDRMRTEIAMVFGVPESVLGDASGRTFDNADAEYEIFWAQTMLPLLEMLDDQMDILTGDYDDTLFLRHDVSDVWVLNRHKRSDITQAAADFAAGLCTLDEYRVIAGKPPFDQPWSRVVMLPGGKVPAGAADDLAEVNKLQMLGTPPPPDPAAEAEAGAQQGSMMGAQAAENDNNARSLRLVDSRPGALEQRSLEEMIELEDRQSRARAEVGSADASIWR
jgi:HK97 family phage portal protein